MQRGRLLSPVRDCFLDHIINDGRFTMQNGIVYHESVIFNFGLKVRSFSTLQQVEIRVCCSRASRALLSLKRSFVFITSWSLIILIRIHCCEWIVCVNSALTGKDDKTTWQEEQNVSYMKASSNLSREILMFPWYTFAQYLSLCALALYRNDFELQEQGQGSYHTLPDAPTTDTAGLSMSFAVDATHVSDGTGYFARRIPPYSL